MGKIGRNDSCFCGSTLKYKKCCLIKQNELETIVDDCDMKNEKSIIETIEKLEILDSNNTEFSIMYHKAQLLQKLGKHTHAIKCFHNDYNYSKDEFIFSDFIKGISYMAIGSIDSAIKCFENVLTNFNENKWDALTTGGLYLEVGKAYSLKGKNDLAIEYWEKSAKLFKDRSEVDYSRAISNIGFKMLRSEDKTQIDLGVDIINKSSSIKAKYGDLMGLSSNYCNLGAHYLREKEFTQAMQKFRWDLKVSKIIPDKNNLVLSHKNMAVIYIEMLQLKEAREQIRLALELVKEVKNIHLENELNVILQEINKLGSNLGKNKIEIGKQANCVCKSGKRYEECCGISDYEPIPFPWDLSKTFNNEYLGKVAEKMYKHNIEPSTFDFIFRTDNNVNGRISWNKVQFKNGLLQYSELPDIANQHLACAIQLAEESKNEPDSFTKPVSCLLLSACALEAFINQVAFFMNENQSEMIRNNIFIPQEILDNPLKYQRHNELQSKWSEIGKILCGSNWEDTSDIVEDFKLLVSLRNEFVHFKSFEYEQLIPPQKVENKMIKKLEEKITFNENGEFPLPWSRRILTPSLAEWCVSTTEDLIDYIKQGYYENRVDSSK